VYTFTPTSIAPDACAISTTMSILVTTLPTGVIDGTVTLCQNANPTLITFTGSNSTSPYTFTYNINGGTNQTISTSPTSSIVTLPVTTSTSGVFTYNLSSITVGNCSNVVTTANIATVTILESPTITISDSTICGGNSLTLSPVVSPVGGQFSWNGPAVNNQTSSSITVNPPVSSVYNLNYSINGCTVSQNINVTVIQNPQAVLRDTSICLGQSVTLTALPNQGVYLWSTGETTQSITVNPTITTLYSVSVSVGGCNPSSATSSVTVKSIPTVIASSGATICNGQSTTIGTTVSAPNGTYAWTPSGTNSSLTVTPTLSNSTIQQTFNYSVVYTLNGCPSLPSQSTVTVNPVPTVSLPSSIAICNGSSGILTSTVNLPNGTYVWTPSGPTTSTISVNPTTNTDYFVTYTLDGCSTSSNTATVVVNSIPTITVNNSTICSGAQAALTAVGSPANTGTYLWSTTATSATINVNPTTTTNYTVTYTVNGCSSQPATAAVTVNPIPTLSIADTTICGGLSVQLIGNGSPSAGTYLWTGPGLTSPTNQQSQITVSPTSTSSYSVSYTANGCTANDNVNVTVIQNPTASVNSTTICFGNSATLVANPANGIYSWSDGTNVIGTGQTLTVNPSVTSTYTVSVSVGGCTATTATSTVTVNPIPTVTAAPGATICNGQSTTIGTTVSAPNGTYAWTPSGMNSSLTVTPTLSNPTVQQPFTYSVVYTLNGCPSLPSSSTVTVNPKPTVSLNNLVLCSGSNGNIQATPNLPNGTYNWSTGVSGLSENEIIVSHVSIPSNQVTIFSYSGWYVVNGCSSDTVASTVTVNPIPNLTSSNTGNICSGGTLNIPLTADVQGTNFLWVSSSNNPNISGESLTNQNSSIINNTLTNSLLNSESIIYNVTPNFSSCLGATQQIIVNVNPIPTVQPISEIICSGGSFDTIPNAILSGNFIPQNTIYNWVVSSTIPNISGQSSNSIPSPSVNGGPIFNSSTSNITLNYSITPITGTCIGSNFNYALTVTPTPVISDKTVIICSGNTPIINQSIGDIISSTTQYTWTILSNNVNITGQSNQTIPLNDFSNQVLVNTTSSVQTISFRVIPSSGPCIGNAFVLTVTVNPRPNLSNTIYDVCSDDAISNLTLGSSGDIIPIGTTYIWNVTNNSNVNGENSNSNPSGTFSSGTLQNLTASNQTVIYTVTPIGPSSSQPQCNGNPFQVSIMVKPTPSLPNVQLPDICSGSNIFYSPSTNPPAGSIINSNTVLNWTVSPNNNVSGQSSNSSSSLSSINQTLTNLSDVAQTVVYTVTPIDIVSSCSGNTFTVIITVQPVPNVQNQSASICTGSSFSITPPNTPPSQIIPNGTTFAWQNPISNPLGLITGGSGQSGQTSISQILNNGSLNDATMTYTVTPSYLVSSELTCIGSDFTVSVVVRPTPNVSAIADDPVICPGSSTSLTAIGIPSVNSSNVPGTYNWTPTNQIVGSTSSSIVTAQPSTTTTFIVVYTLSGCPSQAFPLTVTVQSPPEIVSFTTFENTICTDGCTQITANFIGGTTVDYVQWSTGEITNFAPHTITVCPTDTTQYSATAFLLNCSGNANSVTINVNPDPSFLKEPVSDTAICVGGTFPIFVEVTDGAGTPSYQWFQNTSYTNIGGTAISGANNATFIPPSFDSSGDYYFYCQVSYIPNGCDIITSTPARIRVLADPFVNIIGQDETICLGGTPSCLNAVVSGGIGSSTFEWNPNLGNADILCPSGGLVGVTTYSVSVTQTGIGCASTSDNTITVTVIPDPIVTINGLNTVCYGAQVTMNASITGGLGNVTNYQWFLQSPPGSSNIPLPNSNFANYTDDFLTSNNLYSVSIIQQGVGCNASSDFLISVYPDPVVNLITDPYSCLGEFTNIEANITGGIPGAIYNYSWNVLNPTGAINPLLVQGPGILDSYTYVSSGDTTVFVEVANNGYGCNVTKDTINIFGLVPAIANIGVSNTEASFLNPTFNFFNQSLNATEFFWDLGGCDPQLPYNELYSIPTVSYNPTSSNILDYTYGCPPGIYTVQLVASNMGYCIDTAKINIFINADLLLFIPNSFTPDGDENNETFIPIFSNVDLVENYELQIYNRWGELVFESRDPLIGWDGISNNSKGFYHQTGTYTWKLKYTWRQDDISKLNKPQFLVGHVNLFK